jgi:hypothetical protein
MFTGFDPTGGAAIGEAPDDRCALGGSAEMQVDWEIRIYAATHEMISRPDDDPADQMFKGTLQKAFRIDRSILGSERIGEEITIGLGEVTLTNAEKDYDFLAIDHTAQGQAIAIRMGDRALPYTSWRTVLSGYMVNTAIDREKITFRLRDAGHQLDVPLSPNIYLGTGGTEGTEDLKDKRKPRWFGWNLQVSPPLVIPSALAYQLNDGPIHQVQAVYVRGVALSLKADYASVALMNAASLSVGEYATCLAAGWIRIAVANDAEIGQVTCDFAGDKAGGVFIDRAADIVRRMLKVTTIADPDDIGVASFLALAAAQPAPVGIGIGAGDDATVAQVAGRLMASIGGWLGAKRSGKFEVRRFEAPAGPAAGVYDEKNVEDVQTLPMPEDLSPPPWRVRVGWARNWTPNQTDLAGSVTDERRAFLKEEVRFASAESINVRNDFPPGHEFTKTETFFRDESGALTEAQRLGALYWTPRALYEFPLTEKLFIHELGQLVWLAFPRFDLEGGKLLRIVKLSEDDSDGVTITAFG